MNKTLINLILFFAELLHNNADEKIKAIKNLQQENKDKLLNEIAAILLNYNISDSSLDINLVERKKLYSKLVNLINESIGAELEFEKTTMKDVLKDTGFNKYNSTSYLYSLNVSYDVMPVKEKELDKIINTTIDGKSWSERLYDNKDTICKELKVNINKFLKGEINTNDIGKVLNSRYDVNSYNSDRLIRTEVTRVQAQTNELWAKKHDIQYQLFMATLDHKTSKRCRGYDGKVYQIDDANKPIPPLHPNCRSDLISIPNKDWRPKGRFDNLNKKNINWQTYEEWLKSKEVENISNSGIIEETRQKIKSGEQPLKIEVGKQGKHIMGHNNYIEGRSYLTISLEDAQSLINKYAGTGELIFDAKGNWRNQEVIKTDSVIGYNVSDLDGSKIETCNFKIHYSKKGTHIVPK